MQDSPTSISKAHHVKSVLGMADFDIRTAADNGDDVEADRFGSAVRTDIVVGHADDVLPLLVVNSLFGRKIFLAHAGLHLDDGYLPMVQRNDIHLLVPAAVVAIQDDISLILQIARSYLFPGHAILLGALPALH